MAKTKSGESRDLNKVSMGNLRDRVREGIVGVIDLYQRSR